MIAALESDIDDFVEIIGFRGCSKTTWGLLITPIFFALEKSAHYPFIIIGGHHAPSRNQYREHQVRGRKQRAFETGVEKLVDFSVGWSFR